MYQAVPVIRYSLVLFYDLQGNRTMRTGSRSPVLTIQKMMTRGWGKRLVGGWARTHFGFTVKTTTSEREIINQEEVLSNYVNFTGTDHVYLARFCTLLSAWTTYVAVPAGTKCNLPVKMVNQLHLLTRTIRLYSVIRSVLTLCQMTSLKYEINRTREFSSWEQ